MVGNYSSTKEHASAPFPDAQSLPQGLLCVLEIFCVSLLLVETVLFDRTSRKTFKRPTYGRV